MTATLFVDLDDTLLLPGRLSRMMWRLAKFFQNQGRDDQRPNPSVLAAMHRYEHIILVTSRDVSDRERTLRLLAKHGIRVADVRFCPRQEVFKDWKGRLIEKTAPEGPVDWMDDMFNQTGPVTISPGPGGREVQGLPVPGAQGPRSPQRSESPSL